jgi:hypothetical protein
MEKKIHFINNIILYVEGKENEEIFSVLTVVDFGPRCRRCRCRGRGRIVGDRPLLVVVRRLFFFLSSFD